MTGPLRRAALVALGALWLAPAAGAGEVAPREQPLRVGELLQLPVPSSKSDLVEVEAEGDAIRTYHDVLGGTLLIQGSHPGRARVRVRNTFALFRDPDARPTVVADLQLLVGPAHPGRSLEPGRPPPGPIPSPRAVAGQAWEGSSSLQAEELTTVVTDAAAWTALWRSAFGAPAPAVDFSRQAVACVFLGHGADWPYRIGFGEPRRERGLLRVDYELVELVLELSGPYRASGQYRLQLVPREPGLAVLLAEARPGAEAPPPRPLDP